MWKYAHTLKVVRGWLLLTWCGTLKSLRRVSRLSAHWFADRVQQTGRRRLPKGPSGVAPGLSTYFVYEQGERRMSIRTIIEINHDHLKEAGGVLEDLVAALGHQGFNELKAECEKSQAVRVLAQRHHSYDMEVVIASSPYTALHKSAPQKDS